MKKELHLLASMLLLSFASCTDEVQELESQQSQMLKQIVMTTQDFEPEASSRTLYEIADGAVKCTWAADDTVGVFPDEGAQAYFPMASGKGTKNATFDGGGWALKDGRTYGAYYPFITDILLDRNAVPVDYTGQTQTGNGSMAHLGDYDYMVAPATTSEFGSANFMFKHLSSLVQLKLTVPQPATLTSVKLVAENKAFALEGTVDIMADSVYITPIKANNKMELVLEDVATTEENQVITLYMMLPPTDLGEQTLKAVVTSNKGTQKIELESKNFQAGKAYGLSGEMGILNSLYKDGVVTLSEAGVMKQLLGNDYLNITSLKVVGPINGDDVRCLRQMLGGHEFSNTEKGKLTTLNLSEASIVEGGNWYNIDENHSPTKKNYTSNRVIGDDMFYKCTNLQNIILPDDIISIGDEVFYHCSSLTSINIPDGVTSIGSRAFSGSSALNSVTIKDLSSWCNIKFNTYDSNPLFQGAKLYLNNKELTELVIPTDIEQIKNYTFYGARNITKVIIHNAVTSIGNLAFCCCTALASIEIPNSIASIGASAFSSCTSLTSINIPNSVTSIGNSVLSDCTALKNIKIPNSVTSIGDYIFSGCTFLKSVIIGDGVTTIGKNTFEDCKRLEYLTLGNGITSIDNIRFTDFAYLKTVKIGNSVISIGDAAFDRCTYLTSVILGKSVTSIGERAFSGCNKLKSINIPDGITSIEASTFNGCSSLTSIELPNSITSIGEQAFSGCNKLESINIPNRVTSIEASTFYGCSSLSAIELPDGITSIGARAFEGCGALKSINIPASVTLIDFMAFGCYSYSKSVYISDLSAWCKIKFVAAGDSNPLNYGAKLYLNNEEVTELIIPEGITEIKNYAFYGCSSISKVTFGKDVTSIGYSAFHGCSSLNSVAIGKNVTSIGSYAFGRCSSLTNCYSYATTPPTIKTTIDGADGPSFHEINKDKSILHVPKGYNSIYESSDWKNYFPTIIEME